MAKIQMKGKVAVYENRRTGETELGTPFTEGNEPRFWEYDCASYKKVGVADITLELETEKTDSFNFVVR